MKNLWILTKDDNGSVLTPLLLCIVVVAILAIINQTEFAKTHRTAGKTLLGAVEKAVVVAANQVDIETQAKGEPRIAHKKAFAAFKSNLFYNLKIDSSGTAREYSDIKGELKYWVIIYNGDSEYSGYDEENELHSYVYYTNENGYDEVYKTNSEEGFPFTVGITDLGFEFDNIDVSITLERPGVIAIVSGQVNPVIREESNTVTKWACGKIVKKKN